MDKQGPELLRAWRQQSIPVLFRSGKAKPLLLRLPYAKDNRDWLHSDKRRNSLWNEQYKCWETPRARFDELIEKALARFKRVYVIQPVRRDQKCAPACWQAQGYECECSCMGNNHGSGSPSGDWHVVSETLAVQWGEKEYSCRLFEASARAG